MKQKHIIIIGLLVGIAGLVLYNIYLHKKTSENFSTGFSVTSGLSMYNKARVCDEGDVDLYGARSPHCESIGTLMF